MLRLGVIGCGRVFERFHSPAIARAPGISLSAVCDPDRRRLEWASKRKPGPAVYGSLDALLSASALPEALLILTPPATHAELAVRALEGGLHVLVEKPMALNAIDGRIMADAARSAHRVLQVGFTRRFREPYRGLRTELQAAGREQVRAVHFELAFSTSGWDAYSEFLGDESRGGGVFDDVLSHQVDLLGWLLRGTPEEVSVKRLRTDKVCSLLRFGSLTARCDASHGRYADRLTIELEGGQVLEATGNHFRRMGTALPALRRRRALITDRVTLVTDRLRRRQNVSVRSFEEQLRDFARTVRGEPAIGATAEEGISVLRVLEACRMSDMNGGKWSAPA